MDSDCLKIVSAMATSIVVMAGAIAMLYRDIKKYQEARIRSAEEHTRTLEELKNLIGKKKG